MNEENSVASFGGGYNPENDNPWDYSSYDELQKKLKEQMGQMPGSGMTGGGSGFNWTPGAGSTSGVGAGRAGTSEGTTSGLSVGGGYEESKSRLAAANGGGGGGGGGGGRFSGSASGGGGSGGGPGMSANQRLISMYGGSGDVGTASKLGYVPGGVWQDDPMARGANRNMFSGNSLAMLMRLLPRYVEGYRIQGGAGQPVQQSGQMGQNYLNHLMGR